MAKSDDPDRYLLKRNVWYHYQRSVPLKLRGFYGGPLVRCSLQTQSLERAREQRDALAKADDEYWHSLKEKLRLEVAGHAMDIEPATKRYELAKARALSAGFRYKPLHELADPSLIEELVRRSLAVGEQSTADGRVVPEVADAMLGGAELGAGWLETSKEDDREYLSLKLDDPSFAAPIRAALFDSPGEGTGVMVWNRG